jgi:hypothetical protein
MNEIFRTWVTPEGITAIATLIIGSAAVFALGAWKKQIQFESNLKISVPIRLAVTGIKLLVERYRMIRPIYLPKYNEPLTIEAEVNFLRQEFEECKKQIDETVLQLEGNIYKAEALWRKGNRYVIIPIKAELFNLFSAREQYLLHLSSKEILDPNKLSEVRQILGYEQGEISAKFEKSFEEALDRALSLCKK